MEHSVSVYFLLHILDMLNLSVNCVDKGFKEIELRLSLLLSKCVFPVKHIPTSRMVQFSLL